jgi:methionyl aminopeptidase
MIPVKTPEELQKMRAAGGIVGRLLAELSSRVKPGVTTKELDDFARGFIEGQGAVPTFLGYNGFPASICTSVNEEVVHGIPGAKRLNEGDIIGVDVGATLNGFVGDAARTFGVGKISAEARQLLQATRDSLDAGLAAARHNGHIQDIGAAVQERAEKQGYGVVRDFVGHGVGRKLHEPPQIPNYGQRGLGPKIKAGMTFAIEPMVNLGRYEVQTLKDGWTVVTRDGKISAHFEDTIIVTEGAPEILTRLDR